jgi:hypothetical protein
MYLSDEPLHISIDVVDTLFAHALCDSVAQATPPSDAWKHIEQAVQRFPAQGDFDARHLSKASYMPFTELHPHL